MGCEELFLAYLVIFMVWDILMKPICPFVLSVNEFDRLTEGEYQGAVVS